MPIAAITACRTAYCSDLPSRRPEHPLAEAALQMRLEHLLFSGQPPGQGAPSAVQLRRQAIELIEAVERRHPALAAEPRLRFAYSAALRQAGLIDRAAAVCQRLAADAPPPWRRRAAAEVWLRDRRGDAPLPIARCSRASSEPYLDGALDDEVWRSAAPLRLMPANDGVCLHSEVRLACDAEFLYIAGEFQRAKPPTERDSDAVRPRDADLSKQDRLELRLDIARAGGGACLLAVDDRGRTNDAVAGRAGAWQPKWYVAHGGERRWTVEAAVPLSEFPPAGAEPPECWALQAVRVVPGSGLLSWAGDPDDPDAACGGLLLFDRPAAAPAALSRSR